MSINCHNCGANVPEQHRFCGFCGTKIEVAVPAPVPSKVDAIERGARRLVTVLFSDLTNSTGFAARKDPEMVFLVLRNTLEKLAKPVKRYGGFIDKYAGDGFLAKFGVPEAHEDDPTRALLAALEMQEMMKELSFEAKNTLGWDVQLRIGINVGPVISGRLDTGSGLDWSVYGHTVNLAERLQGAARSGTVLVSDSIYRHTRARFNFRPPVKLHLKGIDESVIGYELIDRRVYSLPTRGLSGRRTPNVGRSMEYENLVSSLQKVRLDQNGVIALVSGEAGLGKTRLVEEVVAPFSEQFTIIRAQCSSHDISSYAMLRGILESLGEILPDDSASTRLKKFEEVLAPTGELGEEIKSALLELIQGQTAETRFISDPKQHQRKIFAAIRRLFAWLARRKAILLVFDDIQWADSSSLEVIHHILDLIHETPLAIVAIARPIIQDNFPEFLREIIEEYPGKYLEIRLQPLLPDESDLLVSLLLSELSVPAELKSSIFDRTNGNPLLIEEMVRMLLDEGVIRKTQSGWQLDRDWEQIVRSVPETVNGLMLARYDRQSTSLKKLLDIASVLGARFPFKLLSLVTENDETELRSQLGELEETDFLRRASGVNNPLYVFRHALMQETIYETILRKERRELHLRAAHAIQQLSESVIFDSAAIIGYHLERGDSPEAMIYLLKAAEQAAEQYANQEAIAYYWRVQNFIKKEKSPTLESVKVELGLGKLLARVGDFENALSHLTQGRDLVINLTDPEPYLGEIHYHLGFVHTEQGQYEKAIAAFEAALAVLQMEIPIHLTYRESDIERELGWVMCYQGKLDEGMSRALSALDLAHKNEDLAAAASAFNLEAAIHYWRGNLAGSVTSARQALNIREELGDVWGAASSQTTLGTLYHKLGQWSQAESLLRQAIFVQQEIGDNQTLPLSWTDLGLLLLDSGRTEEALDAMNQAVELLPNNDKTSTTGITCIINRGIVLLRMGEIDRALNDFERCYQGVKIVKNDDLLALTLAYQAEAYLAKKHEALTSQLIEQAKETTKEVNSSETIAEVLRIEASILESKHNWIDALEAINKSRELFERIGNAYEVARCRIKAAEIRINNLDPDDPELIQDAFRDAKNALDVFRWLNAQVDILLAENILDQIDEVRDPVGATRSQRPVVVVHLKTDAPSQVGEFEELEKNYSLVQKQLTAALNRVAKMQDVILTATKSGFAFVLSGTTPDALDLLALNAIECAQLAVDEVLRMNRSTQKAFGYSIPLRVGIASGYSPISVKDQKQAGIFANVAQLGRQSEATSRLASEYQILVTGDIVNPVGDVYEIELVDTSGDRRIPGPAYRLVRARSETILPRALPGSSPTMVGRKEERSTMIQWVENIQNEDIGCVIYMEAEAGMGKTRLLEEIVEYAEPDILCLWGKCESFRSDISYWPLIDMLENADIQESQASLRLKSLLGLSPPDSKDEILLQSLPSETLRQEFFGRIREFLRHYSLEKPILFIIEDIHWLDLSMLDLLDSLLSLTLEIPFSLMLVARSEMPGPHRNLIDKAERVAKDRYEGIYFEGLTESDSKNLVKALLNTPTLPEDVWSHIRHYSGHPLSLEEALRFMIESNWLSRGSTSWILKNSNGFRGREIPASFKDLLLSRLDNLDSETLHVLQAAAVLGETFDRTVLGRMIPGAGLNSRLTELVERGWLLTDKPGSLLNYHFRHTLTRETIYATLFTSKKRLLHQRAGEAIEQLYPEAQDEYAELVAYHFANSSLREKSLHYLIKAAEKSHARHALAESLSYYRKSKQALGASRNVQVNLISRVVLGLADVYLDLGEPSNVLEEVVPLLSGSYFDPTPEIETACYRRMGYARQKLGELDAAVEHFKFALAGLEKWRASLQDVSGSLVDAIERENLVIQLGMAHTYFDLRNNDLAKNQSQQILRLIDRSKYPEQAAEALNRLAGIAYREEDYEKSSHLVTQSLAIYQRHGNRSKAGSAYANLGLLAAARQDYLAARDNLSLSLAIHESLGDSEGITVTLNNLGLLELNHGHFSESINHLDRAVKTARNSDLNQWLTQVLSHLGYCMTLTGRYSDALDTFSEAESLCKTYDFKGLLCEVLWRRAEVLIITRDLLNANTNAENAYKLATELDSKNYISEAQRVLGRIYRKLGKHRKALVHASTAWRARKDSSDPKMKARFAVEYALALKASNQWAEAKKLLDQFINSVLLIEPATVLQEVADAQMELSGKPEESIG